MATAEEGLLGNTANVKIGTEGAQLGQNERQMSVDSPVNTKQT